MPPLVDLRFPLLSSVNASNEQHLSIDSQATKLVSSVDGEFNSVSISGLDSDRTTLLNRTQKITCDGSATYITGDLNCDANINVQGQVFNVNAETKISDHLLIESDGGATSSVMIKNTNNTSPPLVVQHAGSDILSLAIDGTMTNANIQTIESNLSQEISDRQSAVSNEATSRENADTTLQTNIDNLQSSINTTTSNLQNEIDAVELRADNFEDKTQHITADANETTFDVSSQVKWDTGEQYFPIKSRSSVSVSAATTVDVPFDWKSHQYSVGSNQYGCYEIVLMCNDGDGTAPFFNGKLVKLNGSSVLYPQATYKCSATFNHSNDTMTFTFDSNTTKDFVLSWCLVN